jgi:hypothetical protein
MAADQSALLQGHDRCRVELVGSFGEGSWSVRDGVEHAGSLDVEGGLGFVELMKRRALHVGEVSVPGSQAAHRWRARGRRVVINAHSGVGELAIECGHRSPSRSRGQPSASASRAERPTTDTETSPVDGFARRSLGPWTAWSPTLR